MWRLKTGAIDEAKRTRALGQRSKTQRSPKREISSKFQSAMKLNDVVYLLSITVIVIVITRGTLASCIRRPQETARAGALRFRGGAAAPNQDRPDPPPANQMVNWLFKCYVTALHWWGSAPPPLVSLVSSFAPGRAVGTPKPRKFTTF